MQNQDLARDYIKRAKIRLEAVALLFQHESYADVVREAQECVELALRAILRKSGILPPRIHDVSAILLEQKSLLPEAILAQVDALAKISKNLRRDRELAFYGSEDLTPSDFYSREDAESALCDARFVVSTVIPFVSLEKQKYLGIWLSSAISRILASMACVGKVQQKNAQPKDPYPHSLRAVAWFFGRQVTKAFCRNYFEIRKLGFTAFK